MRADTLLECFEIFANDPDGVMRIRELVLELAVQGRLVAREASTTFETPAHTCVEKAENRDSLLNEEDAPIPQGWRRASLDTVTEKITDGTHRTPHYVPEGVPFVSVKDFSGGRLDFSATRFISAEEHRELFKRCDPRRGDILIGRIGTIGKAVVVDTDREFSVFVSAGLIRLKACCADAAYFRHLLNSRTARVKFDGIKVGGATHTNKLNLGDLRRLIFDVPPLAEQKRIVAKVDELMELCDRLEAQQNQRETRHSALAHASLSRFAEAPTRANLTFLFHKSYSIPPADVRKSILTLAVRGKLVRQNPNDEPGNLLLEKIHAERLAAVKARVISPMKSLPAIIDGEFPYEFPREWAPARLIQLVMEIQTGPFGSTLHQSDYKIGGTPVINPASLKEGEIVAIDAMRVGPDTAKRLEVFQLKEGDVVMARRGEMGRCAIVRKNEAGWLCGTGSLVLRMPRSFYAPYLALLIGAPDSRAYLGAASVGTTMQNLNQSILARMPVGVPPLAEQHRIVAKVDQLMALVDELETQLAASRATAAKLLDAIVGELTA